MRKCVPGRVSVRSACVRRGVAVRKKMCSGRDLRKISVCSARGGCEKKNVFGHDAVRKCVPGGVFLRSVCVRRGVAVSKKNAFGYNAVRKCVLGGVSVRSACVRRGVAVRKSCFRGTVL